MGSKPSKKWYPEDTSNELYERYLENMAPESKFQEIQK